jgi:hypothetical protein
MKRVMASEPTNAQATCKEINQGGCGYSGLSSARFRHATIPAHAALKANASSHDLNRRVMSFGFNERRLDFHIGKKWKFLSDPHAARDASGRCTTSSSIVGGEARDQKSVQISRNFNWWLAI